VPRRVPDERPARPPRRRNWLLPIVEVPVGTRFFRLNSVAYPNPAYFGRRATLRFDAPDASYGVCYLGTSLDACFLEVLRPVRSRRMRRRFVTTTQLGAYYAALATVREPLRLAHLADDGLAQLGIDQRITGGDDYALSQRWSKAMYRHPAQVDGILYPTRHHNRLYTVALFERASEKVAFEDALWGVLGDRTAPDLWVETVRIFRRFAIDLLEEPAL
jgi:hypothetical protein